MNNHTLDNVNPDRIADAATRGVAMRARTRLDDIARRLGDTFVGASA